MNLREFKTRLANHDWYYAQSEDLRLYEKGLAEENALKSIMKGKKTYEQVYYSQLHKYFPNEKLH